MCVCSEDMECQDTDSDAADTKDCGKVKVKWTQEEVIFLSFCPKMVTIFNLANPFFIIIKDQTLAQHIRQAFVSQSSSGLGQAGQKVEGSSQSTAKLPLFSFLFLRSHIT